MSVLRRIDANITSFDNMWWNFSKAVQGEANIISLALGTRRSNTDTDAALWRRTGVNITSLILWGCWVSPWDISNKPAERAISTILHYPDAKTASLAPHRRLFKVTLTLIFAAENMSGNYQVHPWWYRFTEVLSLFCYGPFCQGFIRGFFVSFYFIFFFHLLFFLSC